MTTPTLPDPPLCPHEFVKPPSPQHMPGCPMCLWIELATANETNASLHRRTQQAESGVLRLRATISEIASVVACPQDDVEALEYVEKLAHKALETP